VRTSAGGTKTITDAELGDVRLDHTVLTVNGTSEQRLVIYTAEPHSPGDTYRGKLAAPTILATEPGPQQCPRRCQMAMGNCVAITTRYPVGP